MRHPIVIFPLRGRFKNNLVLVNTSFFTSMVNLHLQINLSEILFKIRSFN